MSHLLNLFEGLLERARSVPQEEPLALGRERAADDFGNTPDSRNVSHALIFGTFREDLYRHFWKKGSEGKCSKVCLPVLLARVLAEGWGNFQRLAHPRGGDTWRRSRLDVPVWREFQLVRNHSENAESIDAISGLYLKKYTTMKNEPTPATKSAETAGR